jgi:hypothetical protein
MSHIGVSSSSDLVTRSNSSRRSSALSGLSDRELLARVKALVAQERATTLDILAHLNEVERRRLHLGLGYPSLFEYCTRHLGYSKSAAGRRIHAARCVRDYPEVYGLLEKNEVNLITVSLIASILTESNAKDLIAKVRGKTQGEVEEIVATYRPPVSMRDRARPVCVAVAEPVAGRPVNSGQGCSITPTGGSEISPNAAAASHAGGQSQAGTEPQALQKASTQPSDEHPASPTPCIERKFLVQFVASAQFMQKFERAKALLSNRTDTPSYETVLEAALDEFLKDHDPETRDQRREARKEKVESKAKPANCGGRRLLQSQSGRGDAQPDPNEEPSRHIPASARDAVFKRDKGRCTYVGSNGIRCGATHHLQIDHIIPYARGGTGSLTNLRLLCERHNKHEAERVYGANAMKRFRARE